MGAWGVKTFENDGALDWLSTFFNQPTEDTLISALSERVITPSFFGKICGQHSRTLPLDGEDALAAAAVVATLLGRPDTANEEELLELPEVSLSDSTRLLAIDALNSIEEDSNLQDCWSETDDYTAWKAEIQSLRSRLESINA